MTSVGNTISGLFSGSSNKAVITAAAGLLNAAESGNWTNTQAIVGYVLALLVWLIPNVKNL